MNTENPYFAASRSWADSQIDHSARMARLAWMVAAAAAVIAMLLAITILLLVPLKTVQPYVLTVDRQSGAVQMATGLAAGKLTQNEAVIQAHLANYVRARESFDSTDLAVQYRRVQLLSSPEVARAYVRSMAADNPASPLRTLKAGEMLTVTIKSVSIVGDGLALVRFDLDRKASGGLPAGRGSFVSALSFGFSERPLRMEDRFDNPLGFQVIRYRRDSEGAGL
jgi:type IV secretion system protein VirB8